jgi:peptidoglycan/LPS O-acetylase OafA/YrhL
VLLPVAAAALLHRYVEAPGLRWGRTRAHRDAKQAVPAAS